MPQKTYIPEGQTAPQSQIGQTMEALVSTIAGRQDAGDESYTHRLLTGNVDDVLKKVCEEATEVALAAKDAEAHSGNSAQVDHLRYESADVVYHLMVVLQRFGISIDEFAAELNYRMQSGERPEGSILLLDEYVQRGK